MVENYDLKVKQTTVEDTPVIDIVGSAVPDGMKRNVTYIKYCNISAVAQTITVYDAETATGTDTKLDVQKLAAGDTIMFPDSPNQDSPIMTVEPGNYLTAVTSAATGVEVTVQYYDE